MVAGPGVFICNQCIELCDEIVGSPDASTEGRPRALERLDEAALLDLTRRRAAIADGYEREVREAIFVLRARGTGWTEIARALRVPVAEVRRRYSPPA